MGRDAITGLVILAGSLGLFWATLGLERHPMVPVGPGFYPRIVLGVTGAFALLLVLGDVWRRRNAPPQPATGAGPVPAAKPRYGLVAAAYGVFGAYVLALPWLGFRLATFAFLVAMPVLLDPPRTPRAWVVIALVAVAATAASYYAFEFYLQVLLPRGRWTGF